MISSVSPVEPRFASLLRGDSRHVWDQLVTEGEDFVVAPTQGSIVPGWLLIVPRRYFLNFAQKMGADTTQPHNAIKHVLESFGAANNAIWFEHGAAQTGSDVGCGVDHAHIHVLLDPQFGFRDFAKLVVEKSGSNWRAVSSEEAYRVLDADTQYYAFGSGNTAFVSVGKSFGRQFFRKVVAELSGNGDEWDYNIFTHESNVRETLAKLALRVVQAA